MTQIIYDAKTGLKTTAEVEDETVVVEQVEPTQEDRIKALESAMLDMITGGTI